MNRSFADLGLPPSLLASLTVEGITVPFPIQAATLPDTLAGHDVMGRGQTGSGKTLAFGLAMLARLAGQRAEAGRPLALVLVPTRELAQQVVDALTPHAHAMNLRMTTIVGGLPISRQARALSAGTEVVIATPGRLRDLVDRRDCRLDRVSVTVLDEADQMVDMGFLPQVTYLLDQVPRRGQRMLFSATLDADVGRLARRYLHEPLVHETDPHAGAVTTMEHHVLYVDDVDKKTVATEIAARDGRVLMFMDTRRSVDRLTKHLLKSGVRAAAPHGGRFPAPTHAHTRRVQDGRGHRAGGVRRRRPWHPHRRPRHGGQRGPARRRQGLLAPRRPYGTCRGLRQRGHPGPARAAPRDAEPDAGGRRRPEHGEGLPRCRRTDPHHRCPYAFGHTCGHPGSGPHPAGRPQGRRLRRPVQILAVPVRFGRGFRLGFGFAFPPRLRRGRFGHGAHSGRWRRRQGPYGGWRHRQEGFTSDGWRCQAAACVGRQPVGPYGAGLRR
ncbi:ATP-dependent RNA helicase RhlE family protein [Streptomyces turgidiscabies Car8]|uniref:ATP-dependent RNA helicase RhlE family protein n=1 Tax=Streptomyces turgidiscabies (strain Car8) TaxID=698760 RepID=L7FCZ6_STRT8|nr:ATP-dependent RNA helicase RhlE family protein [Streptomyces turgidiscabies Car8]